MPLIFSTGNPDKFNTARSVLKEVGIELVQAHQDIDEIQSEDGEAILIDKVKKAHTLLAKPVIVTDDSWEIPGLNGFPGPYMKSINHWFRAEDFLHLTSPLEDRRIFLINRLAYYDGRDIKIFSNRREGELLREVRGRSKHVSHELVAMSGDKGLSQAEAFTAGVAHLNPERAAIWRELADWLKESLKSHKG